MTTVVQPESQGAGGKIEGSWYHGDLQRYLYAHHVVGVGAPPYPQLGRAHESHRITPEPHGHDHCGPTGILGRRGD